MLDIPKDHDRMLTRICLFFKIYKRCPFRIRDQKVIEDVFLDFGILEIYKMFNPILSIGFFFIGLKPVGIIGNMKVFIN